MSRLAVSTIKRVQPAKPNETLATWRAAYASCHIDLGTGDGRFPRDLARRSPHLAVIGVDTCLDHLKGSARRQPPNLRYVTANALTFPLESLPQARSISINFPYGSLLTGLIEGNPALLARLDGLLSPAGELVVRLNASAIEAAGYHTLPARLAIESALTTLTAVHLVIRDMSQAELRQFPSSWARRLGYGRPAAAFCLELRRR